MNLPTMRPEDERAMEQIAQQIGGPPDEWAVAVAEDPSMLVNLWTRQDETVASLRVALAAYRSALRSGERESDDLRSMGDYALRKADAAA